MASSFNLPDSRTPVLEATEPVFTLPWYLLLNNLFSQIGSGSVGTATQVLHGAGAGYSAVNLVTDITGILPLVNGGTNVSIAPTVAQFLIAQSGSATAWKSLSGDVTNVSSGAVTIANQAVTYAKMQNVSVTSVLLGRKSAGAGSPEEITVTGDLVQSASTFTVSANAITNSKLAQMGARTIKGNNTGSTANASDLAAGQFPATQTNDSASAGNLGEFMEATVASGASITLTSATPINLTSIALTPGDWDVQGSAAFVPGVGTSITLQAAAVSLTSVTFPAVGSGGFVQFAPASEVPGVDIFPTGPVRLSVTNTVSAYMVVQANFAVSTMNVYGGIRARRMR